jgi:hypothetical protein
MMTKDPIEYERKEAPQELLKVEPISSHYRVHPIPVFPFQLITIHPVIVFNVADNRLDRRSSFQPLPDRRIFPP